MAIGVLVVVLACSGCEARRVAFNDPIRPADVAFIEPGTTTLFDVVRRLGAPDEMMGTETRGVARYRFRVTKVFRVNFGLLFRFFSPVTPTMALGRGDVGTDVFQVVFDPNWVIQEQAFAYGASASRFSPWPF
ncbi:MAG: hypothetical protein VST64_09630 [Nitrospirota bacterium]|nr:hypothetical protein [Nitrospirota bacterium]MEC4688549.1 hypothetical protein [Nitrospirota bacterium]